MRIENLAPRLAAVGLALCLVSLWLIPGPDIDENTAEEAPAPLIANKATLANAQLFRQVDQRLEDAFGLSGASVEIVGSTLTTLGLSPSPQVIMWPGGRPYLADDFTAACLTPQLRDHTAGLIDGIEARLADSETYFLLAITPDKSTTERVALGPLRDFYGACADLNLEYLESLGQRGAEGEEPVLTAFDEFSVRAGQGEELFRSGDSHWNFRGASIFADLVMERLVRDGEAPADLVSLSDRRVTDTVDLQGDLFTLMGVKRTDRVEVIATQRAQVTTEYSSEQNDDGWVTQRWTSTATSEDTLFVPGRTLILHDSMFGYNSAVYAPYFEDLTSVPLQAVAHPSPLALLDRYDRVIVQEVQRSIPNGLPEIAAAPWF